VKKVTLLLLMLAAACNVQADLYKWVDKAGGVHYSDQAPPGDARKVEKKNIGGNVIEGQDNFALREATRKFPVILYASDCGEPCKQARDLLTKRGIPFAQKNPESSAEDAAALKKLVGGLEVPTLIIGQTTPLKGLLESSWNSSLDAAGYPSSNPNAPSAEKAKADSAKKSADAAKPDTAAKPDAAKSAEQKTAVPTNDETRPAAKANTPRKPDVQAN
jgi:glutaredoxin